MNDIRDEALGELLERAAVRIESAPADRLPDVLRLGTRRRAVRFTAIGAAVAVFVGAISWAGLFIRGDETIPADIADWRTFASLENNGWTVQVPPSWKVQELPSCPNAPQRIGVVVTNTDFAFLSPRGTAPECEDRFVFARFPRNGVALAFHPRGSIFGGLLEPPFDTALPLTPELLIRSGGIVGGPAHSFESVVVDRVTLGVIRRYVGPDASSADVAALDRMLASFSVQGAPRWVDPVASTPWLRVGITHPEGWDVTRFRGITVIDAPQPILMVTSPKVREGYSFCLGGPYGEFTSLGRFGVVVAISDATGSWLRSRGLGARPPSFRPSAARFDDIVNCSGEVRRLWFQFEEAGRPIVVNVLVATSYLREQPTVLWHILDSIRISKV